MNLRDGIKKVYFGAWHGLRGDRLALSHIERHGYVVILNLHRVHPEPNPYWTPLHPRRFEQLLSFVTPRFRVTTFAGLAEPTDDPRPSLVLSFDDGYQDYVDHALPVLRRFGVPSNQNVIVDSVLTGQPPLTVRLVDFLRQAPRSLIDELRLPGAPEELRLHGDDDQAKARYGVRLSHFVKMRSKQSAAPMWAEIERAMAKLDRLDTTPMMDLAAVRSADAEGHEIGAHSAAHDSLEFESDAFFEQDLDRCAAFFEDELGRPMHVYAFPNGSYRPAQLDALFARGVRHALLVGEEYSRKNLRVHHRFTYWAFSDGEVAARAVGFSGHPRPLARHIASAAGLR